ncbi:MAG: carbohydrate kinase [Saprospirales bacterium]|nr:carbohydrate kinase [Saprospirales bacterium]
MERFSHLQVLVVGDLMVDRYITGRVDRISPEAPVPVVHFQQEENRLGGAGNVALNMIGLGARPILCSLIGDDADGRQLMQLLPSFQLPIDGLLTSTERPTTVKTRIMAQHQHLVRIDRESVLDLSDRESALFLEKIRGLLRQQKVDLIVFQDYNKGVLTETVINEVLLEARQRHIPTAVDPKRKNFWAYRGVTLFKPNLKEVRDSVPFPIEPNLLSLQDASNYIHAQLQHDTTLITLSDKGLYIEQNGIHQLVGTHPRSVADVCGAGDTVISVAALGMAAGLDLDAIANLANLAGGQVCEKVGVVPVDRTELTEEYEAVRNGH